MIWKAQRIHDEEQGISIARVEMCTSVEVWLGWWYATEQAIKMQLSIRHDIFISVILLHLHLPNFQPRKIHRLRVLLQTVDVPITPRCQPLSSVT